MTMDELVTAVVGDGSGEHQAAKQNYLHAKQRRLAVQQDLETRRDLGAADEQAGVAGAATPAWELVAILQRCPVCGIEGAFHVQTAGVECRLESCLDCSFHDEILDNSDYFGRRWFLFDEAPADVAAMAGNGGGTGAMDVSTPNVSAPSVPTGLTRTVTTVDTQTGSGQSANASKLTAIEAKVQKWRLAQLQGTSTEVIQTFVQFALARPDEVLDLLPTSPYYIDVTLSKRSTVLEVSASIGDWYSRPTADGCNENILWCM
jgi:hypothetical protein